MGLREQVYFFEYARTKKVARGVDFWLGLCRKAAGE